MDINKLKPDLLQQELDRIAGKINHFDDLRYRTKQMAITLWAAIVGVAATEVIPDYFVLFAVVVPWPFWYVDATYHAYQEGFTFRRRAIQDFLNFRWKRFYTGQGDDRRACSNADELYFPIPDDYGMHTPWLGGDHKAMTRIVRNLRTPKMLAFYGFLCATPIVVWFLMMTFKSA